MSQARRPGEAPHINTGESAELNKNHPVTATEIVLHNAKIRFERGLKKIGQHLAKGGHPITLTIEQLETIFNLDESVWKRWLEQRTGSSFKLNKKGERKIKITSITGTPMVNSEAQELPITKFYERKFSKQQIEKTADKIFDLISKLPANRALARNEIMQAIGEINEALVQRALGILTKSGKIRFSWRDKDSRIPEYFKK